MTDIVERLRGDVPEKTIENHRGCFDYQATLALMREAADEIERLREALRGLWQIPTGENGLIAHQRDLAKAINIARAALFKDKP